MEMLEEIRSWKEKRGAVILAHNYQPDDVQEIADFIGDSLELARKASAIEADVIVFCGVYFMAETAAILNPGKTVLIPDPEAGCPMADMIDAGQLRAFKAQHPGATVMVHPECAKPVRDAADQVLSTGGMCRYARESPEQTFLVGTELGILYRLRKENPGKTFIPVRQSLICPNMKKTSLEKVLFSLREMQTPVTVAPEIARKAKQAIEAMLAIP